MKRYFKWARAVAIIGFLFFITPNSTAADTSSVIQATQYATSVSNFPLQSFAFVDEYLGGTFKVSFLGDLGDDFKRLGQDIAGLARKAFSEFKSALETAISAVQSAITVAAEDTGDALKKAGEVTGKFFAEHAVLIGMFTGAILLTIATDGMMGPVVGELVADDIAVAATEAGVEAGTEATEAGTEAASEAAEAGGDAASKASEAAADGGADSATTIDEDAAAALQTGSTKVETLASKGVRVFSWYSRELAVESIIKAIQDKNIKGALLELGALQTDIGGSSATNPSSINNYITTVKQMLKDFESNNATPNSPASQTQLANLLQQAQALQKQVAAQVTAATAQLPAGSDPANIAAAYGVIAAAAQSATNPAGLTATQQTTVQEWATQHNTASDVVFLAAVLKFANLYNAAQGGTPAQQAAYQKYVNSLPASGLGLIMGFAADGKLVPNTTVLSNQSLLLTSPYEYYLSTQIQAEQNNLTAQQNQTNLSTSVTATNSSNYAIAQMEAALNGLTPTQRASVMSTFYGNALAAGNTALASLMQKYITPNGVIINSNIPTTQTETVQTVISNAQANITAASNSLTTAQNLQNGYDYSAYVNNLSTSANDLTKVAANIPQASTPVTAASVQAQIANSGLSATTQASLTTFLTQNSAQASIVNAVSATIQFAQLFNAAYSTNNPSASAQQAFANYINKLDPHTTTTMMNFAVKNGLVSQQDSLILTDPAQYLRNEENIANQNNEILSHLLNNLASAQAQLAQPAQSVGGWGGGMFLPVVPPASVKENIAKIEAQIAKLSWKSIVNPKTYAISKLYDATKWWSQAQLKALGSRAYYGSILNGNGMASTVQNYLPPAGTYTKNPQEDMAAQQLNLQLASSSGPPALGGIYNNAVSHHQASPQTLPTSSGASREQEEQAMSANGLGNSQAAAGIPNYS